MKRIIFFSALWLMATLAYGRTISNVERSGAWYYLYDENGKKYKTANVNVCGDLKGFSNKIIVMQRGSFIYVYDADLKRIYTGSASNCGEIISVADDTFTTRSGSWVYTYNKYGKRLQTRSCR